MTKKREKLDVDRLVHLRTVQKMSWTAIGQEVGASAQSVEKLIRMRIEPAYAERVAKWYADYYERRQAGIAPRKYRRRAK